MHNLRQFDFHVADSPARAFYTVHDKKIEIERIVNLDTGGTISCTTYEGSCFEALELAVAEQISLLTNHLK